MKKVIKILLFLLLQIFVLTACAAKNENDTPSIDTTLSATEETSVPMDFTQEEKVFFTEFMNSTENNGSLNSEYTTATDASQLSRGIL